MKLEELQAELPDTEESALKAYIEVVGEEYANVEGFEDSYVGKYDDDESFAQQMAEDTDSVDFKNQPWPQYCIDWEYAATELMMDYSEQDGYYFRNN